MKILVHILILQFFALQSDQFVPANIYYVDGANSSASDSNPGTEAEPWKTIQKAASTLVAGETVFIKSGTYNESVSVANSGTPIHYITFSAYPGDEHEVMINQQFTIPGKSYIKVTGLRRNLGQEGFAVKGPSTGVVLDGNYTYGTFGSGISAWGVPWQSNPGNYDNIKDIVISNNTVEKACDGGWNECITLANGVQGFEIIDNIIKNGGDNTNGGEGIDIKEGCSDGVIAGNHIYNLTRRGIYLDGGRNEAPFSKPIVEEIEIYNNVIHDNEDQGIAIMTEGPGDVRFIKIYNNLLYGNEEDGIMYYKHPAGSGIVHDITAINNVCYNNQRYGILSNFSTSYNMLTRNNICYQNSTDVWFQSGSNTQDHNLFGTNPQFVNANSGNFRLQAVSPARDSGSATLAPLFDLDGMVRPYGAGFDIGAYEYSSTVSASY